MLVFQRTLFCVFLIISVAFSKPMKGSDESESSESGSDEKAESPQGPPQPEPAEPAFPNAQEVTDPPYSAAQLPASQSSPILASHRPSTPSALPDIANLPTSTGGIPDPMTPPLDSDPSHSALGEGIAQGAPNTDPINTDIAHTGPNVVASDTHVFTEMESVTGDVGAGADPPHVTTATYDIFPPGAATTLGPLYPYTSPGPMLVATAMAGVPICFNIHVTTPEAGPLRGDA